MDILHSDLRTYLRQRILLVTYSKVSPWLTIDQIFQCYTKMMEEDLYIPFNTMGRNSMATFLSAWARESTELVREQRGWYTYYKVEEGIDEKTGLKVSVLYHKAMDKLGWERNHNYAS